MGKRLRSAFAGGAGWVLAVSAGSTWSASPLPPDANQVLFEAGLRALLRQDFVVAIERFERLSKVTASNRVKLELARAYFLNRQYADAKRLFERVLQDPNVPWAVRGNIKRFLENIDDALGSWRFSIAFVADSNPANVTDNRATDIAGLPVVLDPSQSNDTVYGLEYAVKASRAFTDDASVIGYANATFRDLEHSALDKWHIDTGILLTPRSLPKWQFKTGVEAATLDGRWLYRQPYTAGIYIHDPVNRFRLTTETRIGYLDVPDYDYLNAYTQTLSVNLLGSLKTGGELASNLRLDNAVTRERAYSYRAAGVEVSALHPLSRRWAVRVSGAIRGKNYRDTDPLFLEKRRDLFRHIGLSFINRKWTWKGFTPEFGLAYERNTSNIGYYEYDKFTLIFRAAN